MSALQFTETFLTAYMPWCSLVFPTVDPILLIGQRSLRGFWTPFHWERTLTHPSWKRFKGIPKLSPTYPKHSLKELRL